MDFTEIDFIAKSSCRKGLVAQRTERPRGVCGLPKTYGLDKVHNLSLNLLFIFSSKLLFKDIQKLPNLSFQDGSVGKSLCWASLTT